MTCGGMSPALTATTLYPLPVGGLPRTFPSDLRQPPARRSRIKRGTLNFMRRITFQSVLGCFTLAKHFLGLGVSRPVFRLALPSSWHFQLFSLFLKDPLGSRQFNYDYDEESQFFRLALQVGL